MVGRLPDAGHREQLARERIVLHQLPVGVQVLRAGQLRLTGLRNGRFHGIEGAPVAGQHGVLKDPVKLFGQRLGRLSAQLMAGAVDPQPPQRHAVHRQRAGLVDTQHGRGPEQFHGGHAAREHLLAGQSPRAQAEEDGQHDRQFLREDGHRQGDAGQQPVEPVSAAQAPGHGEAGGQAQAQHGHPGDDALSLPLDRRWPARDGLQGLADAAQGAACAGGHHDAPARALGDQRARVDTSPGLLCLAFRAGDGVLHHRYRLTRQQRFVDRQAGGVQQAQVGGHTVTFREQHDVVDDQLTTGDANGLAVAHDERARTGEVAQGLERSFATALLDVGDRDDHRDEAQQHQGLVAVSEGQVDRSTGHQQQEHRFPDDVAQQAPGVATTGRRQFIGSVARQAFARLVPTESWCEVALHLQPSGCRGNDGCMIEVGPPPGVDVRHQVEHAVPLHTRCRA